ncbi:MAG: FxsA family protein [Arenicellales bacterium]|nr:FxsA family protein [Arenicellales bacterium]
MFPFLLLLFFLVPLIEIYLLIEIGGVIGVGWTIFFVVFTAVLGAFLVRAQGFSTINRIRTQMNQGQLPAMELIEGLFLLIAGALLLTPGFFTDAIGFVCLTPPLRRSIIRYILSKGVIRGPNQTDTSPRSQSRRTIEGEYRHMDD